MSVHVGYTVTDNTVPQGDSGPSTLRLTQSCTPTKSLQIKQSHRVLRSGHRFELHTGDSMSDNEGRTLPPFPVDDFTLDQLEHALNTCIGDDGLVGGDFTLNMFLDFMSGDDPERKTLVGHTDGLFGDGDGSIPIYEAWDEHYTERCVIRALIAEVRRLREVS